MKIRLRNGLNSSQTISRKKSSNSVDFFDDNTGSTMKSDKDSKGLNVGKYMDYSYQTLSNACVTFDKSEFIPTNDDAYELVKAILTILMGRNAPKVHTMMLSGAIGTAKRTDVETREKKQSFCSEFKQMIKSLVGIIGFEFSSFLMIHFGTIVMAKRVLNDMKTCKSYKDLSLHVQIMYHLFKSVPKSNYKFIAGSSIHPSAETNSSKQSRAINFMIDNEEISEFFENISNALEEHIKSKNITKFDINKDLILNEISQMIDDIQSGSKVIENINDLGMNLGKYSIAYEGSFIKLFETLYRAMYAASPKFNDLSLFYLNEYKLHEQYVDDYLKVPDRNSESYIRSFENYFTNIYKTTLSTCLGSEFAPDIRKMTVSIGFGIYTSLAKIVFSLLIAVAKSITMDCCLSQMNGKTSRVQFQQVFHTICTLPMGIMESFTESQLVCLHYILSTDKVIAFTRNKGKAVKTSRTKELITKVSPPPSEEPTLKDKTPEEKGKEEVDINFDII